MHFVFSVSGTKSMNFHLSARSGQSDGEVLLTDQKSSSRRIYLDLETLLQRSFQHFGRKRVKSVNAWAFRFPGSWMKQTHFQWPNRKRNWAERVYHNLITKSSIDFLCFSFDCNVLWIAPATALTRSFIGDDEGVFDVGLISLEFLWKWWAQSC